MPGLTHQREASVGDFIPYPINALAATATPLVPSLGFATTATTAIAGGGTATVITPASMTNLTVGTRFNIAGGTGTAEDVTITAVTATAITAVFANAHSGTYNISSLTGTLMGNLVVNTAGSANAVLSLFNGSPNLGGNFPSNAGKAFAVITNPSVGGSYLYTCNLYWGLFYTLTGTTAPHITVMALDEALAS